MEGDPGIGIQVESAGFDAGDPLELYLPSGVYAATRKGSAGGGGGKSPAPSGGSEHDDGGKGALSPEETRRAEYDALVSYAICQMLELGKLDTEEGWARTPSAAAIAAVAADIGDDLLLARGEIVRAASTGQIQVLKLGGGQGKARGDETVCAPIKSGGGRLSGVEVIINPGIAARRLNRTVGSGNQPVRVRITKSGVEIESVSVMRGHDWRDRYDRDMSEFHRERELEKKAKAAGKRLVRPPGYKYNYMKSEASDAFVNLRLSFSRKVPGRGVFNAFSWNTGQSEGVDHYEYRIAVDVGQDGRRHDIRVLQATSEEEALREQIQASEKKKTKSEGTVPAKSKKSTGSTGTDAGKGNPVGTVVRKTPHESVRKETTSKKAPAASKTDSGAVRPSKPKAKGSGSASRTGPAEKGVAHPPKKSSDAGGSKRSETSPRK